MVGEKPSRFWHGSANASEYSRSDSPSEPAQLTNPFGSKLSSDPYALRPWSTDSTLPLSSGDRSSRAIRARSVRCSRLGKADRRFDMPAAPPPNDRDCRRILRSHASPLGSVRSYRLARRFWRPHAQPSADDGAPGPDLPPAVQAPQGTDAPDWRLVLSDSPSQLKS